MQNGKLNTEQRKALVEIVQSAFKRRIESQREQCNDALARITREVKSELGISQLDDEMKALESRIKEIKESRAKAGFSEYSDNIIPGSKAKEIIEEKARAEKEKIASLESEMDKTISAIWTATELSEIKLLIDDILE